MAIIYGERNKAIICPRCKNLLVMVCPSSQRVVKIACKTCDWWIWYFPKNDSYTVKRIPERKTSSGKVFY